MSESPELKPSNRPSIAVEAEFEIWQNVRSETRRRLTGAVTIGYLYLLAALAVGGYLMVTVAGVCESGIILEDWEPVEIEMGWMLQIAWFYAGLAIAATIAYPLILLLIFGKLPSELSRFLNSIPFIGSTVRAVSMADFCQSIYRCVLNSLTFGDAMARASKDVRDASLRRWSADSSRRLAAGQSLPSVLAMSPMREQPIAALSALVRDELSSEDTRRVWHQAASQCHSLAISRLRRTTQFLSVSCMLVSALLAAFAVLMSAVFLGYALRGISYGGFLSGLM